MEENNIITRNKDIEHIVNAAANVGQYSCNQVVNKRLTLLVTTDIHRCREQIASAVDYLNAMDCLDAGVCLGDIQGGDYAENDGTWYTNEVKRANKPFYTLVGNHDGGNNTRHEICGTKPMVFGKFFEPLLDKIGVPGLDRTYYSVNYDEYKVTLIMLDNYCAPEMLDENGDYAINRGCECIDQEQLDWFVKTLSEVPQGYHVILLRHAFCEGVTKVECNWTQVNHGICGSYLVYGRQNIVPDIINAWIHGTALNATYTPDEKFAALVPVLHVNADFSARGEGIFAGHIVGHEHADVIAKSEKYPEQNVISLAATANDGWQNHNSDLPRLKGTKAEDCLTVVSLEPRHRYLCLVRVGASATNTMVDRTRMTIPY